MKSDLPQELRYRIEKDYADFLEEISGLRPEEWLRRGEEIVLYKNLYRELLSGGDWSRSPIRCKRFAAVPGTNGVTGRRRFGISSGTSMTSRAGKILPRKKNRRSNKWQTLL